MNGKDLFEKITNIDDKIISKTLTATKKSKSIYIKSVSIAACFILVFVAVYSFVPKDEILFELENLVVKTTEFSQISKDTSSSGLLPLYTEDEIFSTYDTAIFKGEIINIQNIEVDFAYDILYYSIATIIVKDVYRGNLQNNDEVEILIPTAIDVDGSWVNEHQTITNARVGMTGIFMPIVYDDKTAVTQRSGILFDKRDIADYGLFDGEHFTFLETEKGLVYAEWAFESISDPQTLDDIEEYILIMIE